jgi:hypothetical protein
MGQILQVSSCCHGFDLNRLKNHHSTDLMGDMAFVSQLVL